MSTSSIVNTLGAGSGIDIKALAESLVEAERAPQKERIDARIEKSETRISGYGALKYAVADLKTAFQALDDASEFNSLTVANSQESAVAVTTSASAAAGTFSLGVSQLAQGQRNAASFAARGTALNGGGAFWLKLNLAGVDAAPVKVNTATPAGLVGAINGADLGVRAQLLDTGNGVVLVMTGPEGDANDFTLSAVTDDGSGHPTATAVDGLDLNTVKQPAADALFTIDGQAIRRASNRVSDVIEGVTLDLRSTTTTAARIDLQRDTTAIKGKLQALVTAYNTFQDSLDVLNDPDSEVETFGGALAGDSLLRSIRNQVRSLVTGASSTPGEAVTHARHAGISIDRTGRMTLDEDKLDAALEDHFEATMVMFTAGKSDKSLYSSSKAGLAGDAVRSLDKMLRSSGLIEQGIETATDRVDDYKDDLAELEDRMTQLLARYTAQFAAMDSIVGEASSTRGNLENSFAGLMAMYTK
ncbi:flagellar filament capping protein FliD [Ramlibacter sp. MAHUQ-53]|uniref:flagellar filament capping protein FliD n=1 Tax=unclassified Ramlibacter TaxID=2617605 RepID=UPI00362785D8